MDQSRFTISFIYEIIPESLHVRLCAEIEMITNESCLVRNIRRTDTNESPLLPELKLTKKEGRWIHDEGNKESNISKAIGEAINQHL
ncbi:MAG TPA: hypothetical protein VI233_18040 [Puia sp.]